MSEMKTLAGMDNEELRLSIMAACKRHTPNINLPDKYICILEAMPLIYGEGMVKGYEFAEFKFDQQLSASQAREAELRERLEAAEGLLLFCLWHSQGGSSVIGQKIRKHFGIGQYDNLTKEQLSRAKDISNAI